MPWEEEVVEISVPTAADNATAVWGAQTKLVTNTIPSVNDIWGRQAGDTTSRTLTASPTDISSLATASDVANIATTANAIKAKTDNLPDNPAAQGTQMSLTNETITAIKSGLATSTNVSDSQTAIIEAMPSVSGLSTFDPATDRVLIDATQAAGMATANVSGLATSSQLATVYGNIIQAIPDISGLSTFNPAEDQVLVSPFSASFIANQVWEGKEAYATKDDITAFSRDLAFLFGDLQDHGDSSWKTATGFATGENVSDSQTAIVAAIDEVVSAMPDVSDLAKTSEVEKIHAGLFNWTLNSETDEIEAKNTSGTTIVTSSITRDSSGNIVAMEEEDV